jgi:hypothetical protein
LVGTVEGQQIRSNNQFYEELSRAASGKLAVVAAENDRPAEKEKWAA